MTKNFNKEEKTKQAKKTIFNSCFRITKNFVLPILIILIILFSINYVSAYKRLCLGYGESLPNSQNPIYTCWHDSCRLCVSDTNYPTHPARCNDIIGCETLDGNVIDREPPELFINSPVDGKVYDSSLVLFDLVSNELASFYYIDNLNGQGEWKRLASNVKSYFRELNFKDGLNKITIKAVDRNENKVERALSFIVDSKKPKIRKTSPRAGFTNGVFEIEFAEENPKSLTLHYGLWSLMASRPGFITKDLDLEKCKFEKERYFCQISPDLSNFDGREIEYWFELTDIVGNHVESKYAKLMVDVTTPIILNPESFWSQFDNKYIYFDIIIDEKNFYRASYSYYDGERIRERRICSRLIDNRCTKKLIFKTGNYVLDIMIVDKAENSISK
ncbi:MAG: hypothetical protein AABW90_01780, partial [Nanoarchaeota archaeon]